ncbi:NADPH-dependent assimilatory sulfite reductase hemoprotein subunit [Marinicella rhabdoformis]|uniref:NADPH-dependent assimilatory sulfite reductase hemoprotein subunit n=1 Tax=Marinicella rhabdoformis TaxID=2580566 RepID=UPI0012AEB9EE|nr:NADPH-dependent assimilatory sulfite reductase hemoprotein subunit [Marinicella rhabdoformis]
MTNETKNERLDAVEHIKINSNYLRGTIVESLNDPITGSIAEDDTQLTKFHGTYQQYDRDSAKQRQKQKLEPSYSFMIRARVPGGICSTEQWLAIDEMADTYANQTIRLTTRQAFQFHGVIKTKLKPTIAAINQTLLDTLAACGDVNRNIMCSASPEVSAVHQQVFKDSVAISEHLLPQTRAYHEIWLDGEKVTESPSSNPDHEPVYGKTYLPRKFKIAVVIPPSNDVDVLAHDLGFIAITENDQLVGYNVTCGGGMGTTHGDPKTFPLLAHVVGFCLPEQAVAVAEAVVKTQRDHGCRTNRKHARFKYTVDDHGVEWLQQQLADRLGYALQEAKPFELTSHGDRFGWHQNHDGSWNHTLFISNGRVIDNEQTQIRSALKSIAQAYQGEFRITPNQNLTIAQVAESDKALIDDLLNQHQINGKPSATRQLAMACVALPTCSLAMAEAERYLPDFITEVEKIQSKHGIAGKPISIRMTGCPNGCARPFVSEVGFVGKAPGRYNMYLGGQPNGNRLNQLFRENITESDILSHLDALIGDYAKAGNTGEAFGDFVIRQGHVKAVTHGIEVHIQN